MYLEGDRSKLPPAGSGATAAQRAALAALWEDVCDFIAQPGATEPASVADHAAVLERQPDYASGVVAVPHKLTVAQVAPSLPPKGVAASLEITDFCSPEVTEALHHPEQFLAPEADWPAAVRSRVHADPRRVAAPR